MNIIATWMYSSPDGEHIKHSQVGDSSCNQKVQDYYWRCVFLLFESSSRLNSDVRHILFVNKYPPDFIDGVDTNALLKQYKIEVVEFEKTTISPSDYYEEWNTQFIILDVLDLLKNNVDTDDNIFILDSDIVFNKAVNDNILNALNRYGALLYSIDYDEGYCINGLTRRELLAIAREMNANFPADEFIYSGGEFFCCKGSEISSIADMARESYRISLERHLNGLDKFNEEAHLLSYVYHVLGYRTHTANDYIKRIWSDRSDFSNIDGSELDLVFWHLPAEKKAGFVDVFRSFRNNDGVYTLTVNNLAQAYRIEEPFMSRLFRYFKQAIHSAYQVLQA